MFFLSRWPKAAGSTILRSRIGSIASLTNSGRPPSARSVAWRSATAWSATWRESSIHCRWAAKGRARIIASHIAEMNPEAECLPPARPQNADLREVVAANSDKIAGLGFETIRRILRG